MAEVFYFLVALLFGSYVALDGFDLGAGALHLFVAKKDDERRAVLGAIGPFWDGNEVWLLAAGGTMLLAFPKALGAALSGFYLAVFLLLWSLMFRGLSLELRSHLPDPLWRAFWDFVFSVSSALVCVLLGVALGNVIRGVPVGEDGHFALTLFSRSGVGLLDGYTASLGAFALLALTSHGATFLAYKTEGAVHERAHLQALWLSGAALPVWLALFAWGSSWVAVPGRAWPLVAVASVAVVLRVALLRARRHRAAFIVSCAFLVSAIVGIAVARYPVILPSTGAGREITASATAVSDRTLASTLAWWPIALLLALGYLANLFRIHRGKVKVTSP